MGTDIEILTELNEQFIEAFRQGSWDILGKILTEDFQYLGGTTGQVEQLPAYIEDLQTNPSPTLQIDQVVIHVAGDSAVVSARCFAEAGKYSRYVDSYHRVDGQWRCFHACVWGLK